MANGELRDHNRPREADVRRAVQLGRVTPYFQPIEALRTGACRGFEALARMNLSDGPLLTPDAFLPLLGPDDRLALFGAMLGESIALSRALGPAGRGLYVSINVEISLVASDDFVDVLRYFLERYDFKGETLVLEILENEDIKDLARLKSCLLDVKALGLSVALDDVGSGYASMARMRELPIDIYKLDRVFVRELEQRPSDLIFVLSMVTLARGLGKPLLVEGIETPEVYDALRVLGVEVGQGYGIARPMPAADVAPWLAARRPRRTDPTPTCLLGAYASHLTVVETCRHLPGAAAAGRLASRCDDGFPRLRGRPPVHGAWLARHRVRRRPPALPQRARPLRCGSCAVGRRLGALPRRHGRRNGRSATRGRLPPVGAAEKRRGGLRLRPAPRDRDAPGAAGDSALSVQPDSFVISASEISKFA